MIVSHLLTLAHDFLHDIEPLQGMVLVYTQSLGLVQQLLIFSISQFRRDLKFEQLFKMPQGKALGLLHKLRFLDCTYLQ